MAARPRRLQTSRFRSSKSPWSSTGAGASRSSSSMRAASPPLRLVRRRALLRQRAPDTTAGNLAERTERRQGRGLELLAARRPPPWRNPVTAGLPGSMRSSSMAPRSGSARMRIGAASPSHRRRQAISSRGAVPRPGDLQHRGQPVAGRDAQTHARTPPGSSGPSVSVQRRAETPRCSPGRPARCVPGRRGAARRRSGRRREPPPSGSLGRRATHSPRARSSAFSVYVSRPGSKWRVIASPYGRATRAA